MSEQQQIQRRHKKREEEEIELDPIHDEVRKQARARIMAIISRIACSPEKPSDA